MHKRFLIGLALFGSLSMAEDPLAAPALEYEAGPGIYSPLGGWSNTLGAGPAFALRVVHPWKPKIAFRAGVGFLQLRGKEDRDLVYQGVPVTAGTGYRLVRMRSEQEIWAWAGAGVLRSRVALSGGKESSADPVVELGLSGSVPVAERLRIALEAKYDEALAPKQDGRGVSLVLGLRCGR